MTTQDKVFKILSAVLMIVLGVLLAINGIGAVLDLYFGIVILVTGVALLVLDIVGWVNTKALSFGLTALSLILISIATALLANWLSFGVIVGIMLFALIGLGVALIVYGVYVFITQSKLFGIANIVIGALAVVFSILYLTIPEFQQAFWIIVGILVALYGVFSLISAIFLLGKK